MKRIIYAGSNFLTGDDIAAALLRYGAALAEVGDAETVTIPAVEEDGSIRAVELLVGPASQIVTIQAGTGATELVDPEVVAEIERRTRRLRPVAVVDTDPPRDIGLDDGI